MPPTQPNNMIVTRDTPVGSRTTRASAPKAVVQDLFAFNPSHSPTHARAKPSATNMPIRTTIVKRLQLAWEEKELRNGLDPSQLMRKKSRIKTIVTGLANWSNNDLKWPCRISSSVIGVDKRDSKVPLRRCS